MIVRHKNKMKLFKKIILLIVIMFVITSFSTASTVLAAVADTSHFVNISLSANPYLPQKGENLKINIGLHAAGRIVTAHVKIVEVSSGYLVLKDNFRAGDGNNQLIWNGKQIGHNLLAPAGTYKMTVTGDYRLKIPGNGMLPEISKTFTVHSPVNVNDVIASTGNNIQISTNNTTNMSTSSNQKLKPKVELIDCSTDKASFQLDINNKPDDLLTMSCKLSSAALVNVGVYKSDFNPANANNSGSLLKTLVSNKKMKAGGFFKIWDGLDNYDRPVSIDKYVIVAEARLDSTYLPDISIQKFSVVGHLIINKNTSITNKNTMSSATKIPSSVISINPVSNSNLNNIIKVDTHTHANQLAGQPSKCKGVNYPLDLPSGDYRNAIIKAYDQCWVYGFSDGTFRSNTLMTRFDATKVIVLVAGLTPKIGCYTSDCGSPFNDLEPWQGTWIRAAWDAKIVSGTAPDKFSPNRPITRAEAAALIVKGLGISPHQNCYNANCGAGYPDNLFNDITQMWEGPYIRALWDKGMTMATGQNTFSPDIPIKRGEFLEMLLTAKK